MTLEQLKRLRWAVRAALLLGVAASVVANVLHAVDNPISQAIAAWPPIALLLTVELISRVPVHQQWLAIARLVATTVIAGIAAWVSYWHMAGVTARYGEAGPSPYLIPISVDGLIVVASICLVELGERIQELSRRPILAHPIDRQAPNADHEDQAPGAEASAPDPAVPTDESGSPGAEEPAGQKARQDPRTAQEVAAAVRAIWAANPGLSQRRIAVIAGTSLTNAGRIIRDAKAAAAAQAEQVDEPQPELADATQ